MPDFIAGVFVSSVVWLWIIVLLTDWGEKRPGKT